MVMFPNENIDEYKEIIPYEISNIAEKSKIHDEIQSKFENVMKNEKNLKKFLVNDLRVFLEKVPKSNVFEYLQVFFE